ncbi:MAG: hypothetical protein AAFX99_34075, partial [Myxococcota bacterium]
RQRTSGLRGGSSLVGPTFGQHGTSFRRVTVQPLEVVDRSVYDRPRPKKGFVVAVYPDGGRGNRLTAAQTIVGETGAAQKAGQVAALLWGGPQRSFDR